MSQALTFNEISFTPITHQNSLWIRATELARALGYSNENLVSRIYKRNAEEFTEDMTQVIEISAEDRFGLLGSAGRCRIFSLRGCHLLAMFARTPVAKAFRRWVLDVLDRLAAEERAAPAPSSISKRSDPERKALTAIINTWVGMAPIHYAAARAQVNAHFGVASVDALTVAQVKEAIQYVQGKIDALPPTETELAALPAAADIDGHLAAIREHIRRIRDHEDAIFHTVRKAAQGRGLGGPGRSLTVLTQRNMENAAWSLHYALESMEASARFALVAGRG